MLDLYGTGDSEGDLSEAKWDIWLSNLDALESWMLSHHYVPMCLIGIRLGCLLGAHWVTERNLILQKTVFCQPVRNGQQTLTQFLRIRIAAQMSAGGAKESVKTLIEQLDTGKSLFVAGYNFGSCLARELNGLKLEPHVTQGLGKLSWLEVGSEDGNLAPASKSLIARITAKGLPVTSRFVQGEPFWSATEIVEDPMVVTALAEEVLKS